MYINFFKKIRGVFIKILKDFNRLIIIHGFLKIDANFNCAQTLLKFM